MRSQCCPYVCECLCINFRISETIFTKNGMYSKSWHRSPSQRSASYIPPISLFVYTCIPFSFLGNGWVIILLSLLGKGSVNTLPRQWIHIPKQKNCWKRLFLCDPCHMKETTLSRAYFAVLSPDWQRPCMYTLLYVRHMKCKYLWICWQTTKYCRLWLVNDRPDLSSERAPYINTTITVKQ
jgi:hypothetical protein